MQIEDSLGQAIELGLSSLGMTPETFDTVDIALALGKLIGRVVDSKMLVKADIHEPVLTRPAIRMNYRSRVDDTD